MSVMSMLLNNQNNRRTKINIKKAESVISQLNTFEQGQLLIHLAETLGFDLYQKKKPIGYYYDQNGDYFFNKDQQNV